MTRLENNDKINNIHMYGIKKKFFCPIGQAECTYEIEIDMEPGDAICDYLEVDAFIKKMAYEQTLESACALICNHMAKGYRPYVVEVRVKCEDAKHMPVVVAKSIKLDNELVKECR